MSTFRLLKMLVFKIAWRIYSKLNIHSMSCLILPSLVYDSVSHPYTNGLTIPISSIVSQLTCKPMFGLSTYLTSYGLWLMQCQTNKELLKAVRIEHAKLIRNNLSSEVGIL